MQESERIFIAENATLLRGSERELNRQLFTILNSIYDGLYITDGQANTILINRAYEEVSDCFYHINMVEMHHLKMYGELALRLGADPRLWSWQNRQRVYWTPGYNQYPREIKTLLTNAITGEKAAIRKYQSQAESIEDPHIVALLKRIILDEELHVEILTGLYETYAC